MTTTNFEKEHNRMLISAGILLVASVGLYTLFDRLAAISVYLFPTLAYCGFWATLGILAFYSKPIKYKFLVVAVLLGLILPIRFINWDSRKPFLKDLNRIEVGMTELEVERIMAPYFKGTGWPARAIPAAANPGTLTIPDATVYRHTIEGWGDSDWGIVAFEDGRVIEVSFSPD